MVKYLSRTINCFCIYSYNSRQVLLTSTISKNCMPVFNQALFKLFDPTSAELGIFYVTKFATWIVCFIRTPGTLPLVTWGIPLAYHIFTTSCFGQWWAYFVFFSLNCIFGSFPPNGVKVRIVTNHPLFRFYISSTCMCQPLESVSIDLAMGLVCMSQQNHRIDGLQNTVINTLSACFLLKRTAAGNCGTTFWLTVVCKIQSKILSAHGQCINSISDAQQRYIHVF